MKEFLIPTINLEELENILRLKKRNYYRRGI